MSTKPLKIIKIPISSVAHLIGLDHYNNFPKTVCELWRKYQKEDFEKLEKECQKDDVNIATDSDARKLVRHDKKHGTNIYQQVKQVNAVKTTSQQLVQNQSKIINQTAKLSTMTNEDKELVKKQIESMTNKSHGVKSEMDVLKRFELESGMSIESGQKWMVCPFTVDSNGIQWCFHGKYDGMTTCGKVIEAKKRQKGLFKKVRDYENVQIQSYLFGTESQHGFLVESYSSSEGMDFCMLPVELDNDYVQGVIITRLTAFVQFFMKFLEQPIWRDMLLKNDKERFIYQIYCTEYLKLE